MFKLKSHILSDFISLVCSIEIVVALDPDHTHLLFKIHCRWLCVIYVGHMKPMLLLRFTLFLCLVNLSTDMATRKY